MFRHKNREPQARERYFLSCAPLTPLRKPWQVALDKLSGESPAEGEARGRIPLEWRFWLL